MSVTLPSITPINTITEFYNRMREEIGNINSIADLNNTILNIKCNQNRDHWLLCYALKHANDKRLYEQGTSKEGTPFSSMDEYASEVFNYRTSSVYEFIQIAEQFEMEESANYITEFGITKTKLLARLKKENYDHFNWVVANKDEIINNSVNALLSKWFKQEEKEGKVKLLNTTVKDDNYDIYHIRAKKIIDSLPEKIGDANFSKEDIDKLYDFACYLRNKITTQK